MHFCLFRFSHGRQALKQMGGALRDMYEEWRHQLKGCLAHAEAVIDFGDDEVSALGPAHLFWYLAREKEVDR